MANPLTLVMPLLPDISPATVAEALAKLQSDIDDALTKVGTVHYARFVVFDRSQPNLLPTATSTGPFALSVITDYDGDFTIYIQDFVNQLGTVFDTLLSFVVGGDAVTPVEQNVAAFTAFVQANDLSQNAPDNFFSLYNAYPYTVQQVLANGQG